MEFRQILKQLREEKNISGKKLSAELQFSPNLVYAWERGRAQPNIETLLRLSDYFDCSLDFLLGKADEDGYYIKQNAQTVAPMGDTLTQDEKDLLKFYRGLNNVQKETVAVLAESLYGKNKAEVGKIS